MKLHSTCFPLRRHNLSTRSAVASQNRAEQNYLLNSDWKFIYQQISTSHLLALSRHRRRFNVCFYSNFRSQSKFLYYFNCVMEDNGRLESWVKFSSSFAFFSSFHFHRWRWLWCCFVGENNEWNWSWRQKNVYTTIGRGMWMKALFFCEWNSSSIVEWKIPFCARRWHIMSTESLSSRWQLNSNIEQ